MIFLVSTGSTVSTMAAVALLKPLRVPVGPTSGVASAAAALVRSVCLMTAPIECLLRLEVEWRWVSLEAGGGTL